MAYLAGSWLLIEVSSEVFPVLMFPDWAPKLVVMAAIAGLPVVFIVAWIFDLTAKGVIRTAPLPKHKVSFRQQPSQVVGRDLVLQELTSAFQAVGSGSGQVLGIAGEAGMGKSTVTETFLERLREGDADCLVGIGRSSERHGETSAYMPLIEALTELVNNDESGAVARDMAGCAPTWYGLVFPNYESGDEVPGLRANSQGRMQHELGVLLSQVCARQPVVICFDDFHWADVSTLDALVYLADHLEGLGLLLIVSYRESELQQTGHPFVSARLSLRSHGSYRDIELQAWDQQQVKAVIESEFPENRFPEELHTHVYERTAGHPLFVVELIRYMKNAASITQEDGVWVLTARIDQIAKDLPGSVKSMIERKMGRIGEDDWKLLSAASVQGQNFDSAVLARVLGMDAADIEERLEHLERFHTVVKLVDERELPDKTLSSRYSFGHILFYDYLLSNLRPSRKVNLARSTADALSAFYQQRVGDVAPELAHLFADAREPEKAAAQYLTAASNSTSVFAYRESAAMAKSGLGVVASASQSADRDRLELLLQLALGRSLCMTEGYGSQETMSCFARALELTKELTDGEQNLDVIWSLWMAYTNTGNRGMSLELSNRLQTIASDSADPLIFAAAQLAAGFANEIAGSLPEARDHFERVIDVEMTDSSLERASRFVVDPLILARGNQLRLLTVMGLVKESGDRWRRNLALIDSGSLDPRSIAGLLIEGAWFNAFNNRFEETKDLTDRTIEICKKYDFFMESQWATFLQSWANVHVGDVEQGLSGIAGFIGFIDATGALMHAPLYYAIYGEILLKRGRPDEAGKWVKRGLEVIDHTGQDYFASEIYRLQGELAAEEKQPDIALASLEEAHRIAREQDARLLELRATLSLHSLMGSIGATADGARILRESMSRMHDGFDSDEMRQARLILQETE